MTLTRRQMIGLLGIAGLAGCAATQQQQDDPAPLADASTAGTGTADVTGEATMVRVLAADSLADLGTPAARPALGVTPQGSFTIASEDEGWRQLFAAGAEADLVLWRDAEQRKHAFARDGFSTSGWEFAEVLQSGLDHLTTSLGGGVALVRTGYYELTTPVTVPQDVRLDTAPGAILANHLDDKLTPCVRLLPKAGSKHLVVDANGGSGVRIGDPETFNNLHLGLLKVYGAGDADGPSGTNVSIDIRGYNIKWDHIDINGGAVGLRIDGADIFGTSAMIVNSAVGVDVDYAEHVVLNDTIMDSCTDIGMSLDHAHDVTVRGSVWFNAQLFSAAPQFGVAVGRERRCSQLRLELSHMAHGGTAMLLDRVTNSLVSVLVTNDRPTGPEIPFQTGVVTTQKTADSVLVSGYVDPSIPEPLAIVGGSVSL